MSRARLAALIVLGLFAADLLLGVYFRLGTVMASSRNARAVWQPTIKIREVRRFPLWAFFLASLDDNPQYRFECSIFDSPYIWSSQSFTGESYTATSAQIEWAADGTATVYLEHQPYFTCRQGIWTQTRAR